jgi:hypothetical protein
MLKLTIIFILIIINIHYELAVAKAAGMLFPISGEAVEVAAPLATFEPLPLRTWLA